MHLLYKKVITLHYSTVFYVCIVAVQWVKQQFIFLIQKKITICLTESVIISHCFTHLQSFATLIDFFYSNIFCTVKEASYNSDFNSFQKWYSQGSSQYQKLWLTSCSNHICHCWQYKICAQLQIHLLVHPSWRDYGYFLFNLTGSSLGRTVHLQVPPCRPTGQSAKPVNVR